MIINFIFIFILIFINLVIGLGLVVVNVVPLHFAINRMIALVIVIVPPSASLGVVVMLRLGLAPRAPRRRPTASTDERTPGCSRVSHVARPG